MKEKVMVFEIKDKTYIALSESGEFLERSLTKSISVGDYLYIRTKQDSKVREFKKKRTHNYYPLLKVAAVILIAISLVFVMSDNVSVIATIDINPSFEFHLDDEDEIVKAVPLSPQAENMNEDIEFKGLSYQQGLTNLIEESINQGYIKQTQQNLVIVSMFDTDGKEIDLEKKGIAFEIIEKISEDKHLDLVVASYDVSKEEYNQAKEEKTSVNKVIASKKASELGIEINKEDINKKNIRELAKEQGIAPGLLISEKAQINEIEAAPPGLTEKDVLPPGHQKKDREQYEQDDKNKDKQNSQPETPPGLSEDKEVGNKPEVPPGQSEDKEVGNKPKDQSSQDEDKKDKSEVSSGKSDDEKSEKSSIDSPGQNKKGELEDDEEINEEKDLPPGLENNDNLPKGTKDVLQEQLGNEDDQKTDSNRKSPPGLDKKGNLEESANEDADSSNSKGNTRSNPSDKGNKNSTN